MSYSNEQLDISAMLTIGASTLSLIGSGCIIFAFIKFPKIRGFPNRLLLYLSIADVGNSAGFIAGAYMVLDGGLDQYEKLCVVQGWMVQFFGIAANVAVFCMTLGLYLNCMYPYVLVEPLEKYCIFLIVFLSTATSVLGVIFFDIKPAGPWCWFLGKDHVIAQESLWFSIVYAIMLWIIFVYVRISVQLLRGRKLVAASNNNIRSLMRRFSYYPVAYAIVWMSSFARRVIDQHKSYPLLILQVTCECAQGFFNFLGYYVGRKLYVHWYKPAKNRGSSNALTYKSSRHTLRSSSTTFLSYGESHVTYVEPLLDNNYTTEIETTRNTMADTDL